MNVRVTESAMSNSSDEVSRRGRDAISLRRPLVIAVASSDCFAIPLSEITFSNKKNLGYELEQFLPVDAEELVYVIKKNVKTGTNLCIAIDRRKALHAVLEQERNGCWIACVAPFALLASDSLIQSKKIPGTCNLCWEISEDRWDLLKIKNGLICQWTWLNSAQLQIAVNSDSAAEPYYICSPHSTSLAFDDAINARINQLQISQAEALDSIEKDVISGKFKPWYDLRSSQLPSRQKWLPLAKPLTVCLGIIVISLCVSLGLLIYQIGHFARASQEAAQTQQQVFEELFPRQRLPNDIAGRLTSELRKLKAEEADLSNNPQIESSVAALVKLLVSLPEKSTIRIDRLSVREAVVLEVNGAAETLEDYEKTTNALKKSGFSFSPPSTAQMKDGYTMRFENLQVLN